MYLDYHNLKIYITKISKSVCPAMHFVILRGIELKLDTGVGDGPTRFLGIFSKQPHPGSKVIQRSICHRNALCLPNLVRRTPDQSIMHYWGQRSCRGQPRGQPWVNLLNCPMPPNLVERTSDQSIMYCWGQRSCRGRLGSTRGQIA